MKAAVFTAYGRLESQRRVVKFHKRDGVYVCEVEGMPSLTISHPSYDRVRAAFEGWYQLSNREDYGTTDIDWGDMESVS